MTVLDKLASIVSDPHLSAKQKSAYLALEAEASLPYVEVSETLQAAMQTGIICDMFEGHAPFKPRYVLPDYAKFLRQGSRHLELAAATDLDEAINALIILYHHVPSVTNMPVYLGQLDELLMPYVEGVDEQTLYRKLKNLWIMLDRTLPDAFVHVNIGPRDNIVCRTLLKIDAELKQVVPNLTFMYDPATTPDDLLLIAASNICECNKPHIANYPMHASAFDEKGFGIVSCYNALPLAGGANTLVRINLKLVACQASSIDAFFEQCLPSYCALAYELIEARAKFLHQESHFFDSFLVKEGLIEPSRFAPMFGIYGMAEAVDILLGNPPISEQMSDKPSKHYGHHDSANQLGYRISKALDAIVKSTPVTYGYHGRALLHSQSGISLDVDVTPGVRIPYGTEPNPVAHIQALAPHHQYYTSGISDILTIDATVKQNPEAMYQLCKGAFNLGFREFSANVASNDLIRVTGYMIKLSDIATFKQQGSRTNTTGLGAEAAKNTGILKRQPRVAAHELTPCYGE
ncbi:YjjI family glycine radical enzyme [Shewanella colwelliana]|uniref:YjjI family glycine radical enzyme n=1 Tax=Shewanella colwelliana TaxID=23 RepID=UPI0022AFC0A7|nr:YjjI family glycine radical enzyme [Shewanella colwelliana]MCZ4338008.1 YjjI family glycine radical enzyme [Shewanella colwelliana]